MFDPNSGTRDPTGEQNNYQHGLANRVGSIFSAGTNPAHSKIRISCSNVSNLLLARGNSRALGAHSWRIIRQNLLKSLLLALAGCVGGLLMAMFGIEILVDMVSGLVPQALYPELDRNVFLFSIAIAIACGILLGILPALRASRPDLNHSLKQSPRTTIERHRLGFR